jgi:NADH:ubiquinone oxidoreductase subunit H
LQAVADGLKLAVKELIIPSKANRDLFLIAPAMLLALSFIH